MSALCKDCGVDTAPCTGKRGCRHKGKWEYYMVHNDLWQKAGMEVANKDNNYANTGYLCVACLEHRIGRTLNSNDFTAAPVNDYHPWHTERLLERQGFVS